MPWISLDSAAEFDRILVPSVSVKNTKDTAIVSLSQLIELIKLINSINTPE